MKIQRIHLGNGGFTLVELIIAMTIFSIMSIMTILIYFNISETGRRLQISRELSETAREITERIAEDVKKEGVSLSGADFSPGTTYDLWKVGYETRYGGSGSEILPIGYSGSDILRYYVYGKRSNTGLDPCNQSERDTSTTYCGLFVAEKLGGGNWDFYDLVDSFREDPSEKRVKITDLKFYITGGDTNANKVTLKMTLELMPRAGVPASLVRATKLEIQTTFSERFYKIQ